MSAPEAIRSPEVQQLIDDMLETMAEYDGAGLAAPQVHVSRRIVIYGVEENPRYPDAERVPLTVLINPVVTALTEEEDEDWEGCLSVPGLRGLVPRVTRVRHPPGRIGILNDLDHHRAHISALRRVRRVHARVRRHGSEISKSRHIFRARKSLTSRCRGTVEVFRATRFTYTE